MTPKDIDEMVGWIEQHFRRELKVAPSSVVRSIYRMDVDAINFLSSAAAVEIGGRRRKKGGTHEI